MTSNLLTAPWLHQHSDLGILPLSTLADLIPLAQVQPILAEQVLVAEGDSPEGLVILLEGKLGAQGSRAVGSSFLPGTVLFLQELLADQPVDRTYQALCEGSLAIVPASQLNQWVTDHPEVGQAFSRQLAQQLAQVSAQLNQEQERQTALLPYRVPRVERGIVGSSRYAVRLRHQITQAAESRDPVLVFGEPGLEKDNICALIHFSSTYRREPLIKVNAGKLQQSGAELFGRAGGKPGLLEWLGEGTLILNNIQELPESLCPQIAQLLEAGTYRPISRSSRDPSDGAEAAELRPCRARILLISERVFPPIEKGVKQTIKVPPVRVRKADIKAQVDYYISLTSRSRGIPKPKVTPEALRRLQSYDFPGNTREMRNLVERAMVQSDGSPLLTEEVFWSTQAKGGRFRLNLLNANPILRQFLRSSWWPDQINYWIVLPLYTLVVGLLFWGPQDRGHNIGLNLFWAWWWPLILLGFPFVGRLWCAVCPFMIYGEITQKLSLWLFPRALGEWPRRQVERWGGWFLVGLFALIFLWEELWDLQDTAYLSAWLLLLITAGAMICSLLFERRFWCRYLCPIGGMNGLYAKLSMIELRAQQGTCSAECTTYQCYKGGPAKGEGQETLGCPVYSHPAQMQDNKDCVLCMTCLKACPHRSVELNLRPPGIELWTSHNPRNSEVALLLLLLGGVFLHRLPEVMARIGIPLDSHLSLSHLGWAVLALGIPAVIPLVAQGIRRLIPGRTKPLRELAYGYLPLVLAATLAHYLRLGLTEAGQVVPVTLATFGIPSGTLGSVPWGSVQWVAHPAVIAFLQGSTLLTGWILAVILTQKIARQAWGSTWPHHLGSLGLMVALWQLIL